MKFCRSVKHSTSDATHPPRKPPPSRVAAIPAQRGRATGIEGMAPCLAGAEMWFHAHLRGPYGPTPVERCKLLQNGHAGSREFHMCRPLSRGANFSKTGTRGPGNSICAGGWWVGWLVGVLVGGRGEAKTKNLNLGDVAEKIKRIRGALGSDLYWKNKGLLGAGVRNVITVVKQLSVLGVPSNPKS